MNPRPVFQSPQIRKKSYLAPFGFEDKAAASRTCFFMKKILFVLGWGLFAGSLNAQLFSVDDLLGFTDYSSKRFDHYITKKGFVSSGHFLQSDSVIDTWDMIPGPADSNRAFVHRRVLRYQTPKMLDYSYQTASVEEAMATITQMKKKGFTVSDSNWRMEKPLLLQRREWLVTAERLTEDTLSFIEIRWHKQYMPSAKETMFADDLLRFKSDEYLAAYFGREHVRKDQFYFSENEINRCSVLFPNTAHQVIFIWADNAAQRDILQVMVGAGMRTEDAGGPAAVVGSNKWQYSNGISTHMRLEQILQSTGKDIFFFGRKNPLYLSLVPESARLLGMHNATVVLECINGAGNPLLDQEQVSATAAVAAGLKLHVSMIVLWPADEKP